MFHVKHCKQNIGQIGENAATDYLAKRGYEIICRNYRTNLGELDIVARKSGKLIFIEVKTMRQCGNHNEDCRIMPEEHLDKRKVSKLQNLAQMFHVKHPELVNEKIGFQIDLIAIDIFDDKIDIRHYENI